MEEGIISHHLFFHPSLSVYGEYSVQNSVLSHSQMMI